MFKQKGLDKEEWIVLVKATSLRGRQEHTWQITSLVPTW